ncbi:MAG: beta-N-acetylhexosaminidase [Phototrophicales bacterium]|nr:MAG: beta-N-acetylhexosaminidase [Phototrophicales bacterium]
MTMIEHIEERVGQMLMVGFDGLTAPDYLLDWLRQGRVGGIILFARNIDTPEQVAALTTQLRQASKHPLLISIDQEGGTVARLREHFTESPGALALAHIPQDRERITEQVCGVLAQEMHALGINWTYAPVVDVAYNQENPTVGTRSFGADPAEIAVMASAAVRGFQAYGVAACAKHFPGLGNTTIDTHLDLPRIETSLEHLRQYDLVPYHATIQAGLATIMTTHTIFNTLDSQYPATLSRVIVQRLIREELQFDGVVTTDCMEMKAIDNYYPIEQSVVWAANAGIDIILFSHTPEKQAQAYDALLAAVKRGDVSEALVDAANARIHALKARFPLEAPDLTQIHTPEHQAITLNAARLALKCVRGDIPPLSSDQRALLIEFAPRLDSLVQDQTPETHLSRFIRARLPQLETRILSPQPTPEEIAAVNLDDIDVLILATRNAHLQPQQAAAVQQLYARAKQVVLLALRNPYDVDLIDGGTAICTYGDSIPSLQAVSEIL